MSKLSRVTNKLKKTREVKEDFPISEDSALESIIEILDYYDIPMERVEETMQSEQAGETLIDAMTKYFRRGQIETERNDKNELTIIQHLQDDKKITYQEVRAKHKRAMDKTSDNEGYKRRYAFLGSLCGLGSDAIESLKTGGKWNDLACAEFLGAFFLLI
mgnify:CR=1 FL=1